MLEDTSYRASIEITHEWEVPASAEDTLDLEQRELIYYPNRTSGRTEQMIPLAIRTILSLERSGKAVKIETTFNNQAKDHRLRILFPTDMRPLFIMPTQCVKLLSGITILLQNGRIRAIRSISNL